MLFRIRLFFEGLLCAAIVSVAFADDPPRRIEPQEARKYLDQSVEVVFEVKTSKYSARRKTAFLDSEENFQDPKNLGIAITESGINDLKQKRGVDGPADYYRGKKIRVVGKVILREEKPYLEVNSAEQLDLAPQT